MDELYALVDEQENNQPPQSTQGQNKNKPANGLGVGPALGVDDEEVTTKARREYAKLDASKLQTEEGIPYIRKTIAKKRNLFKGKGHEKRDLNKLLNEYQMWAHGLFPKANFNDFIQLCRVAGDSKSMKLQRIAWIDEEKAGEFENPVDPQTPDPEIPYQPNPVSTDIPDDELMDELMAEQDDIPDDDVMNELMAEQENKPPRTKDENDENDEMEHVANELGF